MADLPGPAWWRAQFGFDSFEEFEAAAEQYVEGAGAFGFTPPTELVLQNAYQIPSGSVGTYIYSRLTLAGYSGEAATSGSAIANGLFGGFLAGLQQLGESNMVALVIPDAFQVSINATCSAQEVVNVVGVVNASGDAAGAAAAVRTAWKVASGPLTLMPPVYVLARFRAMDLSSANGDIAEVADATAGGGATSTLATMGACALVKWNGGTRSRSTRGRMYFGPLVEGNVNSDGRTLAGAYVTQLTTAMNAFRTSLSGAGYPLAVLSRKESAAYPVSSLGVENVLATQRRRIRN